MKESDLEKMDNMFPNGYVVIYTCPDNQIRLSLYNPHKDVNIDRFHKILAELEK